MLQLNKDIFRNSAIMEDFLLSPTLISIFDEYEEDSIIILPDNSVITSGFLKTYILLKILRFCRLEFYIGKGANYKAHFEDWMEMLANGMKLARPNSRFLSIGALTAFADLHKIKHLSKDGRKGKTVIISDKNRNDTQIVAFLKEWEENIIKHLKNNGDYDKDADAAAKSSKVFPLMPSNWIISSKEFENHLATMSYNNLNGNMTAKDVVNRFKIKPSLTSVYWSLTVDGKPPEQEEFIEQMLKVINRSLVEGISNKKLRYRIGGIAYPALVRQHHCILVLIEKLGKDNVFCGPFMDLNGVDCILQHNCKLHGIHFTTDRNDKKQKSIFNLKSNITVGMNWRTARRIGCGSRFLLHNSDDINYILQQIGHNSIIEKELCATEEDIWAF